MPPNVFRSLESILTVLEKYKHIEEVVELLKIHDVQKSRFEHPPERKYLLIVFEGLDGSGKSTLSKITCSSIFGQMLSTPPDCVRNLRDFFDGQESLLRRAFYSLGNYIASYEINSRLNGSHILLDRFWHSTAAYALAESDEQAEPSCYEWPEDLIRPDVVFYLKVSEAVRRMRMKNRTLTSEESRLNQEKFRIRLENAYMKMSNPGIREIDSNLPKNKVKPEILRILHSEYIRD